MLKLKLQYFGHLMWRANSLEKILMLRKVEGMRRRGDRGWDGWMASLNQWTWVWANSGRWWRIGKPGLLQSMGLQRVRHDLVTEQQQLKPQEWSWSFRAVPSVSCRTSVTVQKLEKVIGRMWLLLGSWSWTWAIKSSSPNISLAITLCLLFPQ